MSGGDTTGDLMKIRELREAINVKEVLILELKLMI